ncbi:uncharacterized protein BO96DRAFT_45477 [Aspergillus niger CBS 101883]|uniref:Uncharacterized protein n=1 Tax=Aspergillus niger ATCC 13496 TaxID=1353008 RepID=A0A370C005_ASPNG|nr:uncharacterized protein BO96DRAFT_45477 [Aspergillus niger CBS 101883]PYH57071.1 hypothetical protein BO96DRAFT_45477 [Aspergillus niger CBS 101883]RDH21305.1 hypothetical protein M747DRAFT_25440 [Aspergillus niger ATCC 13496]
MTRACMRDEYQHGTNLLISFALFLFSILLHRQPYLFEQDMLTWNGLAGWAIDLFPLLLILLSSS